MNTRMLHRWSANENLTRIQADHFCCLGKLHELFYTIASVLLMCLQQEESGMSSHVRIKDCIILLQESRLKMAGLHENKIWMGVS
jgi:hypothetical protein